MPEPDATVEVVPMQDEEGFRVEDAEPPEVDAEPPEVDAEPSKIDAEPNEVDAAPSEVDAEPSETDAEEFRSDDPRPELLAVTDALDELVEAPPTTST